MVKVITINILFEMETWAQRRELLVEGLAAQQADLIGLQEVKLPEDNSAWLAQQLNMPYVQLVPYKVGDYGAAILSRYRFTEQDTLDLESQGRVAQYVQVEVEGQPLVFCNGHYYWYPGANPERVKQVQLLLDWLGKLPPDMPIVAVGDFNGMPETPAIALMQERFTSAYAAYHGREPDYTCPTPLKKAPVSQIPSQFLGSPHMATLARYLGLHIYQPALAGALLPTHSHLPRCQ
ncbi:endonuclease/exonuclease/phosphatase family protein [Microseira wollei]|uniref:Endonuclease/exonuclease/phosphatase domain-containing protein n=1 Tax=Microseira wollei NIES-4236 TaxID=2530354 RepID=A0AAV3X559_9CYAN|nr:endonuclease/exonuclease/phosphatase family protein [Microseira wollei]GET37249.1 hypothetical protein MiSe_20020 [Microseira wollei NIES-4236]